MTPELKLPALLAARLAAHLDGERVVWVGRPAAPTAFVRSLASWLIAIPWAGISFTVFGAMLAAAWVGPAPSQDVPWWQIAMFGAGLIFAGGFAAIGVGLLATPFVAARTAARTVHAITNRRLVTVVMGRRSDTVRTVLPQDMLVFDRRVGKDGRGTLTITTGVSRDGDGDRVEMAEVLRDIPDVATAERLLRGLKG